MAKRKGEEEFIISEKEKIEQAKDIIKKTFLAKPKVVAKNLSQKALIKSIKDNEITICSGIAGTGKTYVSLAYALSLLADQKNKFITIYLVKSVTTLKNEEVGFLRGDLREKFEPFMMSFKINLEKVLDKTEMIDLFNSDILRPFPLAYIKGSSLDNCIIIADEIQNVSIDNCRTLMTRLGKNSKLILLGDSNQIDLKNKSESCLEPIMEMFNSINEIGTILMDENDDNCRNPLIKTIETKFKDYMMVNYKTLHKDYGNGNGRKIL